MTSKTGLAAFGILLLAGLAIGLYFTSQPTTGGAGDDSVQAWVYQEQPSSNLSKDWGVELNYVKPPHALLGSRWMVKHGELGKRNLTIPTACWNADPAALKLRAYSYAFLNETRSRAECYDGTNWLVLSDTGIHPGDGESTAGESALVFDGNWATYGCKFFAGWRSYVSDIDAACRWYEEAMWWKIDYNSQFTEIDCPAGSVCSSGFGCPTNFGEVTGSTCTPTCPSGMYCAPVQYACCAPSIIL